MSGRRQELEAADELRQVNMLSGIVLLLELIAALLVVDTIVITAWVVLHA